MSLITRLKRVLPRFMWRPIRALGSALYAPLRFSVSTGHFRSSLASKALDAQGNPLPWYTYAVIDFLSARSYKDRTVLEFGGGQSTLWWASRAKSVVTIDSDESWTEYVCKNTPGNVDVHYVPVDLKSRTVEPIIKILNSCSSAPFDLVVIDGHLRQELVDVAFEFVKPDGAVIMDNSENYGFEEMLERKGCMRVDFQGFPPGVSWRTCTSIAFRDGSFLFSNDHPIETVR